MHCNADTQQGGFASASFSSGGYFNCETWCDSTPACGGWTWTGGDGAGGGTCYAKKLPDSPVYGHTGLVSGIGTQETVIGGSQCPDGTQVHDTSTTGSLTYTIHCGYDTNGSNLPSGSPVTIPHSGDYTSCQHACDTTSTCTNWVYVYDVGAGGGGPCYLKSGTGVSAVAADGNNVAGISSGVS